MGHDPAEASRSSGLQGQIAALEYRASGEGRLSPLFAYLEGQLGAQDYLVANRLTIADVAVASPLVNLRHAGFRPDAARFPKLGGFIDRMHARPSFKTCIEEERPIFGKRWK